MSSCSTVLLNQLYFQGEIVKEDKPCRLKYQHLSPKSAGPASMIDVTILKCEDRENSGAPQYKDDNSKSTQAAGAFIKLV